MKLKDESISPPDTSLRILLADDDMDDRFFFKDALSKLPISTQLATVDDGERLMTYLARNSAKLPDVLFLDLNMPRKNGAECLNEIKADKRFKNLPVIIYSTSLHDAVAEELYKSGAHYYMQKGSLPDLREILHYVLTILVRQKFVRQPRNKFILKLQEA